MTAAYAQIVGEPRLPLQGEIYCLLGPRASPSATVVTRLRRAKEDCGDLSRKSIGNLHGVATGAGLQSFQKERSLRFRSRQFKRFPELFGSSCMIVQSHLELADHGVE
jgi:hypothetical protein